MDVESSNPEERRLFLIEAMGQIDEQKRQLKDRLPGAKNAAKQRIRREIKALQRQREEVRLALAEVNQIIRAGKAVRNRGAVSVSVAQAFVEVARRYLEQEDFEYLYSKAVDTVSLCEGNNSSKDDGS